MSSRRAERSHQRAWIPRGRVLRARLSGAVAILCAVISGLGASACGTACDDASTICGFDTVASPADCTDANECAALCIVDYDSCDVNNAEAGVSKCIASCLAKPDQT